MEKDVLGAILGSYININKEIRQIKDILQNLDCKIDTLKSNNEIRISNNLSNVINDNNKSKSNTRSQIESEIAEYEWNIDNLTKTKQDNIIYPIWISNKKTTEITVEEQNICESKCNVKETRRKIKKKKQEESISSKNNLYLRDEDLQSHLCKQYNKNNENTIKEFESKDMEVKLNNSKHNYLKERKLCTSTKLNNKVNDLKIAIPSPPPSSYGDNRNFYSERISSTQLSKDHNNCSKYYISSTQQRKKIHKMSKIEESYNGLTENKHETKNGLFALLEKEIEELY